MTKPTFTAKGVNGQIELYPNKVRIRRKGVVGFLTQGLKGDKDILMSSLSSIQFKKAGFFTNGYIQFAFFGGNEAKGGFIQATYDENTVMFNIFQKADFERLRTAVEKGMQVDTTPVSTLSGADEIAKLADLRDKGVLTDGEFQQKKTQILDL